MAKSGKAPRKKRAPEPKGGGPWPYVAVGAAALAIILGALLVARSQGGGNGVPATTGAALPPLDEKLVAAGKRLFEADCLHCHGAKGVGEKPGDPNAIDTAGLPVAPALDGSMHAWHHTDSELADFILNGVRDEQGVRRNPRMPAWKEQGLTEADARTVVEYLKSLWGDVERRCQGPAHMDPTCTGGSVSH